MLLRLLTTGAIGLVSGILVRSFFAFDWSTILFVLLIGCVFGAVASMSKVRVYLYLSMFCLCLSMGMARTELASHSLPEELSRQVGSVVTIEGVVVANPDIRETSQRLSLRVAHESAHTKILVVAPLYPSIEFGDRISVSGTLAYPEPFDTLEGRVFDYPHFLAKDGLLAIIKNGEVEVTGRDSALSSHVLRFVYRARHGFEQGVSRALPEPAASLAVGLVAGGKQGLGKHLLESFTIAGLLPIVVLSGYNVMIVAEAILHGSRFLPKRLSISVALLTIIVFVVAAGSGASAVRAGIMACVGLFARATGRTYHALRILFAVFVLMLLFNPLLLVFDPGFQFSFAATLGLIVGTPLLVSRLSFVTHGVLRETVATTIAAQIFVLPLLLYQVGNLSLVAIPANVLVLPFVPLTMLLSFIAGLVGVVLPAVAPIVGLPAYLLLSAIMNVAEGAANLPLSSVVLPQFSFVIVVVLYGLIALACFYLKRTTPRQSGVASYHFQ